MPTLKLFTVKPKKKGNIIALLSMPESSVAADDPEKYEICQEADAISLEVEEGTKPEDLQGKTVFFALEDADKILFASLDKEKVKERILEIQGTAVEQIETKFGKGGVSEFISISEDEDHPGFRAIKSIDDYTGERTFKTCGLYKLIIGEVNVDEEEVIGMQKLEDPKGSLSTKSAETLANVRFDKEEMKQLFSGLKNEEDRAWLMEQLESKVADGEYVVVQMMTDPNYKPEDDEPKSSSESSDPNVEVVD